MRGKLKFAAKMPIWVRARMDRVSAPPLFSPLVMIEFSMFFDPVKSRGKCKPKPIYRRAYPLAVYARRDRILRVIQPFEIY